MKQSLKLLFCAAGVLAGSGLTGCGGGGSNPAPTNPIVGPETFPQTRQATLPNGLTASVTENGTYAPVGGVIVYRMSLANNTAQPITFQPVQRDTTPSNGLGDALTVKDAKGTVVFPHGAALEVVTYGPSVTLAPGKVLSGVVPVSDDAIVRFPAAGHYTASVDFTSVTEAGGTLSTGTVGPLTVDAQ